jgi:DNA-binding HxlR family transcriptional regulator
VRPSGGPIVRRSSARSSHSADGEAIRAGAARSRSEARQAIAPIVLARGKYNVYAAQCPTRRALDRIADKWTALIVGLLAERTHRFGELRRSIEGISHKVLVQTLRSLERDGLVHRQPLATNPPTVEYSLTPLGTSLVGPLASIRDWAEEHIDELQAARDAYTRERGSLSQGNEAGTDDSPRTDGTTARRQS